ncbi:MAG: hypothetical protein M9892_03290 [Bacteroidetes bacterium]|nr:hypothetical protein [Bacteroidota bacterium]
MRDNIDILKAWAGASVTLMIQQLGWLQDSLSLALIAVTCLYTGFKAYNEWIRIQEKKRGGKP